MTVKRKRVVFRCNDAPGPKTACVLEYRPDRPDQNIVAGLPRFVSNLVYVPERTLDLLEIAAYVFAGDRKVTRGRPDDVIYDAWSRSLEFRIRVRDYQFWTRDDVGVALSQALEFITGDASVTFTFFKGHETPPTSLFDRSDCASDVRQGQSDAVALFSGGLDSLAGALELIEAGKVVRLASHESHTGTVRTQRALLDALSSRFSGQVSSYRFRTHLSGARAPDETQRSRAFLYCSIAFALAEASCLNEVLIHENGVTSINLYRRQDLANARASRTTHPLTAALMGHLLTLVAGRDFAVRLPFGDWTKCEVVQRIAASRAPDLVASAVSCSKAFRHEAATHCGTCLQCVDRRLAIFAAGAHELEHGGLYETDIATDSLIDPVARTTVIDYVRQAGQLREWGSSRFEEEYASELAYVVRAMPKASDDFDAMDRVRCLMQRHGENVLRGVLAMRELYDKPFEPLPSDALLELVGRREHLKPEAKRLVESILRVVEQAIPQMFKAHRPDDEPDFNAKVTALIGTHEAKLRSEHPVVTFACAIVVPDHKIDGVDVLIESKYIRGKTTPSKASEGIAADLTKYPDRCHIVFLVYDPDRAIKNDKEFVGDFERRGRCTIAILR
jgi:7-cyano-7-deazaguanine synthase in queuosine biosynthesis